MTGKSSLPRGDENNRVADSIDSNTVLWGQTLIYSAYALAVILLIGWFAQRLTHPGRSIVPPKFFYSFVGLLVVVGGSLHLITYNTIPWTPMDLNGAAAVETYEITVAEHQFHLPSNPIQVPCQKIVKFSVVSEDLTYGFGVFRPDNSMVFQMQVVPGHANDILWKFTKDGTYTIRSTEYSGPVGHNMVVRDSVVVTGCGQGQ